MSWLDLQRGSATFGTHALLHRSVFIHPATQRDHAAAWDAALETLRYGSINVNAPAVCGFAATPLVWGAYPGNTPQDIGSGDSYVHNTFLFDHPEKSVCAAPWTYAPQPLWSVFQVGLQPAIPHAMRYITNQHRPLVALFYLVQVSISACFCVRRRTLHSALQLCGSQLTVSSRTRFVRWPSSRCWALSRTLVRSVREGG
jgi:hypothetical protein